jgi:PII-like signaling protein
MTQVRAVGQAARIYIGEADKIKGKILFEVIVRTAREMGLPGATVFRGVEGFGAKSVLHTARLLRLSDDLPILIEVIDLPQRLGPFLEEVEELLDQAGCGALITLEDVQIIRYGPKA